MAEKKSSTKTTKNNTSKTFHRIQETYNSKGVTQARTAKVSDTKLSVGTANYNSKGITQARNKSTNSKSQSTDTN